MDRTDAKKTKLFSVRNTIFIICEALLYITFMYTDIVNSNLHMPTNSFTDSINSSQLFSSGHLKYYSIIICLGFAIFCLIKLRNRTTILMTCAFLFTVIADFFLLLHSDNLLPGIAAFCVVHFIYLLVIKNGSLKSAIFPTLIRVGIAAALTFLLVHFRIIDIPKDSSTDAVIFLSIFYAASFIGNIIRLGIDKNGCAFDRPSLFLLGLVLFLLCDLNVLIYNLGSFISIKSDFYQNIRSISEILMWGFYLPSQVIIALSACSPKNQH